MSASKVTFGLLIATQTAHSIEEYVGRLWESFAPAAFMVGLASSDPERGFIIINCAFVAFGFWCLLWPMRRDWPSATFFAWLWVVIEGINGIGHMGWSVLQRAYTPGVLTAPILLALALYLASRLQKSALSKEAWS
jgi:Protein of unknown function with HXXEE motif